MPGNGNGKKIDRTPSAYDYPLIIKTSVGKLNKREMRQQFTKR